MELKKRHTGLWIFLSILLALLLGMLCWLSTGPRSLTPDSFRYGFYPLSSAATASSQEAEAAMAGDGIITDRSASSITAFTYVHNQREESVIWQVYHLGSIIEWLHANVLSVWVICTALSAFVALLWITAPRRRIKRMQETMKKNFQTYGVRFEQEDEGIEY